MYNVYPNIEEGLEFPIFCSWKNSFYISSAMVRSAEELYSSAFSRSVIMDLIGRLRILAKTK